MTDSQTERFWQTLLGYIAQGKVLPVVGQELLVVEHEGRSVRLMDVLASRLAKELRANGELDETRYHIHPHACTLSKVIGLLPSGVQRREVMAYAHSLLREMCATLPTPTPLRQLAEIEPFRLFLTTTVDGLLARHLDDTAGGLLPWQRPTFFPGAEPSRADIRQPGPFLAPVVCQVLGFSSSEPGTSALTDEETLEFITALNDPQRRPALLFDELKRHHLLILGTGFPDWLARFFLRLLKGEPFSMPANVTSEYIAEHHARPGSRLAFFLERFSQKSQLCPGDSAVQFVAELHRRWRAATPCSDDARPGGVFISYSRGDLSAVERLATRLREAGIQVWFDQRELQAGDPFWQVIERNIAVSSIFLPVLSTTTRQRTTEHAGERRDLGFWREWLHAAECLEHTANGGLGNVTPVVVDADPGDHACYLPAEFRQFNIAHAPSGDAPDGLLRAIVRRLRPKDALAVA